MKKILGVLIACFAIFVFSCNDNAFDFSQLHSIDAEGCWGIPVADVHATIEDILNKTDNIPLHANPDGLLQLEYDTEVDSVISSDQILHFLADQQVDLHGTHSIDISSLPTHDAMSLTLFSDTLTADLPSDKVLLEMARIKSGLVRFSISHNCPISLTAELSCPQLTNATGGVFSQTVTISNNSNDQISLAGYTLTPEPNNRLKFYLRLSVAISAEQLPDIVNLSYDLSVGNFDLEEIRAKVAPISINVNRSIDLKLDYIAKTMGGSFTVYNPDIRCEVYNMFPIDARIVLNEAALHGPEIPSASLIATSPATIDVPSSTAQFENVDLPISPSLTFNPKMNEAHVSAKVTFNPGGFNTPAIDLREGEYIHFKVSFKLPLHLQMDNISFRDTLAFPKTNFPAIEGISNMVLRCLFENNLPLDLFCQVYFYNSETQTIQDSLFDQTQLLVGCYGPQPSISEAFVSKDDFGVIRTIFNCDKIILKATISTDGQQVCVRNDQKLRLRLGAKFNLNLGELSQYLMD